MRDERAIVEWALVFDISVNSLRFLVVNPTELLAMEGTGVCIETPTMMWINHDYIQNWVYWKESHGNHIYIYLRMRKKSLQNASGKKNHPSKICTTSMISSAINTI
jgi:hypothetical protein